MRQINHHVSRFSSISRIGSMLLIMCGFVLMSDFGGTRKSVQNEQQQQGQHQQVDRNQLQQRGKTQFYSTSSSLSPPSSSSIRGGRDDSMLVNSASKSSTNNNNNNNNLNQEEEEGGESGNGNETETSSSSSSPPIISINTDETHYDTMGQLVLKPVPGCFLGGPLTSKELRMAPVPPLSVCETYGLYKRKRRAVIIDSYAIAAEYPLVLARLLETLNVADHVILQEMTTTHTGDIRKTLTYPTYLEKCLSHLGPEVTNRISHVVIPPPSPREINETIERDILNPERKGPPLNAAWVRENYLRNSLGESTAPVIDRIKEQHAARTRELAAAQTARRVKAAAEGHITRGGTFEDEDVDTRPLEDDEIFVVISDADEIPRPLTFEIIRQCGGYTQPMGSKLLFYYYNLRWKKDAYWQNGHRYIPWTRFRANRGRKEAEALALKQQQGRHGLLEQESGKGEEEEAKGDAGKEEGKGEGRNSKQQQQQQQLQLQQEVFTPLSVILEEEDEAVAKAEAAASRPRILEASEEAEGVESDQAIKPLSQEQPQEQQQQEEEEQEEEEEQPQQPQQSQPHQPEASFSPVPYMDPHQGRYNIPESYEQGIAHGGWHLSYFLSAEDILKKIKGAAHSEFNVAPFNTLEWVQNSIDVGRDLFNRGQLEHMTEQNCRDLSTDFPAAIKLNPILLNMFCPAL